MAKDVIVECVEQTVLAVVAGESEAARRRLSELDVPRLRALRHEKLASVVGKVRGVPAAPNQRARRVHIAKSVQRTIFERDAYTCRLCGLITIDADVLRRLSALFPTELPFHAHWRRDATSPIYWTHTTSLEHVTPIARGGAHDASNFATSCYACNDARCDLLLEEVGWCLRDPPAHQWRGLREHLPFLR